MITPLSYDEIKKIHSVEYFQAAKVSSCGGLMAFAGFLDKLRLKDRLAALIGEQASQAFLQVMVGIFLGARTMLEVAELTKDPIAKGFLGKVYDATRIPRLLKNLAPSEIQKLHEFCLSQGLLEIAQDGNKGLFHTIDIDATAVEKYGGQEGVEYGYVDKDKIERCYQYLLIRNDRLGSLIYGTIRGGSAHSQNDFCGYLNMILPAFDGQWSLRIRADSGYFNEQAFEICSENKVFFFIKAPISEARRALARSPHLEWQVENEDISTEFASYETVTAQGWYWREVFKRTKDTTSADGYRYSCIATNDMDKKALACFDFYNGRARIENHIDELKNDYALGAIVTKDFGVNDILTQATLILNQLVDHFSRHCLDKALQSHRLSTLRKLIFLVPAEILRSARKQWYRVYNTAIDGNTYGRIHARIKRLSTLLVLVPILDTG